MIKKIIQILLTPAPSFIRKATLRLMGAKIAEGVYISPFTVLVAKQITLDPCAEIKPFSIINAGSLVLGAYAAISNFCIINGSARLKIGPKSSVTVSSFIDLHADVTVGEYSAIGPLNTIMTHGILYPSSWGFNTPIKPVTIGDFVYLNTNCKITPGVKIASNTMVLSNSVLRKSIKKSGIVFDNSIKREVYPFYFLQNHLEPEQQKEYLVSFAKEVTKKFFPKIKFTHIVEDKCTALYSPKLTIFIQDVFEKIDASNEKWLFAYNVDEKIMQGKTAIKALDFASLLFSSNSCRKVKKVAKHSRSIYGNRFADYKHKSFFKIDYDSIKSSIEELQ